MDRPGVADQGEAGRSEGLGREDRIRRRADYLRVYADGRRVVGRMVVGFAAPSPSGRSRIGVTVTRKAGNAVQRNRLRRRLKEAYRRSAARPPAGAALDVVFNVRDTAAGSTFAAFSEDVTKVLFRLVKGGGR